MRSRDRGAIFCQVEISSAVFSVAPCNTSGYHRWVGVSPSFSIIAIAIVAVVMEGGELVMDQCPFCQAVIVLAKRMVVAASVWTRKYLIVASAARGWCGFMIIGRMLRVFNSRPIQASSQWWLAMVIMVLVERLVMRRDQMRGLISIGRG